MNVLRLCGIENLTDVVEEEIITEMSQQCPRLQMYMVQCVPLLQKFLYNNYSGVYQNLILGGMVSTLARLQCIEVSFLLFCVYNVNIFVWCFYDLFSLKNVFVENHGLLFRIDIVPYSINQPLKLCLIQILMDGTYTMVQYVGLNVVP